MILSLCSYGGYMLYSEMFGRMAPNTMFNETFEIIRIADEVHTYCGFDVLSPHFVDCRYNR